MLMLFSWLSKLLASLLVVVLTGAVFTMVLNQTVLNSKYLKQHLASTDSYSRLSVALSNEITKVTDQPEVPADLIQVEKLKTIFTPTLLQTKIDTSLDQLESFYRGNGQVPSLDLTDVVAQAEAAGIPIPADSEVRKPITFGSNQQAQDVSKTFDQVRTGTLIASLVLVAALLFVSWERHKWAALPDVLIIVGVLLGLAAIAFAVVSNMAGHYAQPVTNSNAFEPIGRDLAANIARDLAKRIGIFAGAFAVVGIVTRVLVARMHSDVSVKTALKTGLQRPAKV